MLWFLKKSRLFMYLMCQAAKCIVRIVVRHPRRHLLSKVGSVFYHKFIHLGVGSLEGQRRNGEKTVRTPFFQSHHAQVRGPVWVLGWFKAGTGWGWSHEDLKIKDYMVEQCRFFGCRSWQSWGLSCVPTQFIYFVLTPRTQNVTVFGDGSSKWWWR